MTSVYVTPLYGFPSWSSDWCQLKFIIVMDHISHYYFLLAKNWLFTFLTWIKMWISWTILGHFYKKSSKKNFLLTSVTVPIKGLCFQEVRDLLFCYVHYSKRSNYWWSPVVQTKATRIIDDRHWIFRIRNRTGHDDWIEKIYLKPRTFFFLGLMNTIIFTASLPRK